MGKIACGNILIYTNLMVKIHLNFVKQQLFMYTKTINYFLVFYDDV